MHEKKTLGIMLSVIIIISFAVFLGVTQVIGVPLWWIFSGVVELSGVGPPRLLIEVSPESPMNIGDKITATVTNSSSKLPVENAEVDVIHDSMNFKYYTDSNGQVVFEYLGEVTVAQAQMNGIGSSQYVALPKVPDVWVRGIYGAIGGAVASGFFGALFMFLFQKRQSKTTKIRSPRKIRKK